MSTKITLVSHCPLSGDSVRLVRSDWTKAIEPFMGTDCVLFVRFYDLRRHRREELIVMAGDMPYITIDVDGTVVYDSRQDVPVDMDRWQAVWRAYQKGVSPGRAA